MTSQNIGVFLLYRFPGASAMSSVPYYSVLAQQVLRDGHGVCMRTCVCTDM